MATFSLGLFLRLSAWSRGHSQRFLGYILSVWRRNVETLQRMGSQEHKRRLVKESLFASLRDRTSEVAVDHTKQESVVIPGQGKCERLAGMCIADVPAIESR